MYSIVTAESLVHAQTLSISPNPEIPQPPAGLGGKYYSKYGIGYAASFIPMVLLADFLSPFIPVPQFLLLRGITSFTNTLYGSLALVLIFLITERLGCTRRTALLSTILCMTASILLPYAKIVHSEMPAAVLVLAQILIMLRSKRLDLRQGLLLGLCTAALISLKTVDVIFAIPAFVHMLRAIFRKSASPGGLLLLVCIPAAAASGLLALNVLRFGSIFEFGYGREVQFNYSLINGLQGFLLSPSKSIFLFSPLLIAAAFALPRFMRSFPATGISLVLITGTSLGLFSLWHDWHGGWCFGPRFMVPSIIALHILIGPFISWFRNSAARLFLGILTLIAIPVQLCGALVSYQEVHCFYWDPFSIHTSQLEVAGKLLVRKLRHEPEIFFASDFEGSAARAPEAITLPDGRLSLEHKETYRGFFTLWSSLAINRGLWWASYIPLLLIMLSTALFLILFRDAHPSPSRGRLRCTS